MIQENKEIIWQLTKDYKPEYICGFDDYLPEEAVNFWNKIKKKIGLKYKVKESNSYGAIGKIETIDGKQIVSYDIKRDR